MIILFSYFTEQWLVVAGGCYRGVTLTTVEIMDTPTRQWSTATSLPEPLCYSSATVCGDRVFLLGGNNQHQSPTKSVYTCSLNDLLKSSISGCSLTKSVQICSQDDLVLSCGYSRQRSLTDLDQGFMSKTDSTTVWNRIAALPVTYSSCVCFHGNLLTIGGRNSITKLATMDVRVYRPSSNTWEVVGHMTKPRRQCFAGVLQPGDQLVVVGGETTNNSNDDNDIMEIATIA